ncbi:MAG: hypothetical protein NZM07_00550 [Elioraea sp.]|nr:hypothetical protein [Elioraea sp.]MDW8399532.1 hypothetical protein [Acetobacteraceae bacterium]
MQRDHLAGEVPHEADQRRVAGPGFEVRQVGVEEQVGAFGHGEPATLQVAFRGGARDRSGVFADEGDLARRVALGLRRGRRRLLAGRALARPAGHLGGVGEQRPVGEAGAVRERG